MRRPAAVLVAAVIAVLATAGTASAATRTQSFVITQTNDNPRRVTALGMGEGSINATGRDVVLSETDTGGRDRFVFPAGNLIVVHTKTSERATCDPSTGMFTVIERGTYKITRGTGQVRGLHRVREVQGGLHRS